MNFVWLFLVCLVLTMGLKPPDDSLNKLSTSLASLNTTTDSESFNVPVKWYQCKFFTGWF